MAFIFALAFRTVSGTLQNALRRSEAADKVPKQKYKSNVSLVIAMPKQSDVVEREAS